MSRGIKQWPIDDSFDEQFADKLARLESYNKHIYRPNTYLHKWWARRCGTTFRLILKGLVADSEKRDYYTGGGLNGQVVLDPMMGGGTTLHEAIRLGANVIGIDIDPIPLLQARATLSPVDLDLLRTMYLELYDFLIAELRSLFRTQCPLCDLEVDLQFMLHGLVQECSCLGGIFLDSTILRYEPDGAHIIICEQCHHVSTELKEHNCSSVNDKKPIYQKGVKRCPLCDGAFQEDISQPYYSRYTPVAAACRCPHHGFQLATISQGDLELIYQSNQKRKLLLPKNSLDVKEGPKAKALIRKGVHYYEDLFSSRQIAYILKASEFTAGCDELIGLNLGLLVSTSLDLNSMLCGYKGTATRRAGAVRHVFSHHAYSFPYTALENNPIYPDKTSGSIQRLYSDRIERGKKWSHEPRERATDESKSNYVAISDELDMGQEVGDPKELKTGERRFHLLQGSAANTTLEDDSVDFIITDPPYYDNVQYDDLAAYFRVWLRRLLPEEAQDGIEWDYQRSSVVARTSNRVNKLLFKDPHIRELAGIFSECQRVLRSESGRLIFTFHHWKASPWAALTIALRENKFGLVNYSVVHAVNPMAVHIVNLRSIQHDAILVLAPKSSIARKEWLLPHHVNSADSSEFCANCAQILGSLLLSDFSDQEILAAWEERLA